MNTVAGYQSLTYASSFANKHVFTLPGGAGSLFLPRRLPDGHFDLAGVYPYSIVDDWFLLASSREQLQETGAISIVLVSCPFAEHTVSRAFRNWDICRPFKRHQIADLSLDWQRRISKKVRYDVRRAYKSQTVEILPASPDMAASFWTDYQNLFKRHKISGFHRFSQETLRQQLSAPGGIMAISRDFSGAPLGQILLFGDGRTAHAHLWAVTRRGYQLATAYALFDSIFSSLQQSGYRYLNLGGTAGQNDRDDGLLKFKRRWASEERMTFLCGLVLNRDQHDYLLAMRGIVTPDTSYFPAYRRPDT